MLTERVQDILDSAVALPLPEAAPLLSYTPESLRLAARAGRIPATRVGGRWMIPTSYIREVAETVSAPRDEFRAFATELGTVEEGTTPVIEIVKRNGYETFYILVPEDEEDWNRFGMKIRDFFLDQGVSVEYAPSFS